MSKRTSRSLRATAFHEAGHAVAAVKERVRLRSLSIEPDEDSAGRISHANPLQNARLDIDTSYINRMRMERLVRVSLAGPAAQQRFARSSWRRFHGSDDYKQALRLLYRFADGKALSAYFNLLQAWTESFLYRPGVWAQVSAVASALLKKKTLSAREVRPLMREAFKRAMEKSNARHAKKARLSDRQEAGERME